MRLEHKPVLATAVRFSFRTGTSLAHSSAAERPKAQVIPPGNDRGALLPAQPPELRSRLRNQDAAPGEPTSQQPVPHSPLPDSANNLAGESAKRVTYVCAGTMAFLDQRSAASEPGASNLQRVQQAEAHTERLLRHETGGRISGLMETQEAA